MSRFFALVGRLKYVTRWTRMRSVQPETTLEHSFEVAAIAQMLAVIRRDVFGKQIDTGYVAEVALYHDVSEVVTGDMPTPIKYHSPEITRAYKAIEEQAQHELLALVPDKVRDSFRRILVDSHIDAEVRAIVKAADTIAAVFKARFEVRAGNSDFVDPLEMLERKLAESPVPEVAVFMEWFGNDMGASLDKLLYGKS